jgi:HEAT repeat protein
MTWDPTLVARLAPYLAWLAMVLALSTAGAVVAERALYGIQAERRRRFEAQWAPVAGRAVAGDADAERALIESPSRDRFAIATLLVMPLIEDRDPARIARTRGIVEAMALSARTDGLLESVWWWRRALALRAIGLLQIRRRAPRVVAALDDWHIEVRGAALDALADLRDPATLPALVVRLLDTTLPRGRRAEALVAFGSQAEPLVLEHAEFDSAQRVKYAFALRVCGTGRSRPTLSRWAVDGQPEVRAAAFDALAHVGLDEPTAALAIAALDDAHAEVRAAAARALKGWTGPGDAAARLARHLDDTWIVAAPTARALQSIVPAGVDELRATAARTDLAGLLARQMLWELQVPG